jgi:hypothetical protein
VAIHQPNFFPWLGFFNKLRRADVFIVLDDVQFVQGRGGPGWANRVRILSQGAAVWCTAPVRRAGKGLQPIRNVELADDQPWRAKLLNTLKTNYGRAAAFADVMALATDLVEWPDTLLARFNVHAIQTIARRVGLDATRIVTQSELGIDGHGTDLLVKLVRSVDGTTYLSGDGAGGYLEPDMLAGAGIGLRLQRFVHPQYAQHGAASFVAGLSILDALMHCGFDGCANLLGDGVARA